VCLCRLSGGTEYLATRDDGGKRWSDFEPQEKRVSSSTLQQAERQCCRLSIRNKQPLRLEGPRPCVSVFTAGREWVANAELAVLVIDYSNDVGKIAPQEVTRFGR